MSSDVDGEVKSPLHGETLGFTTRYKEFARGRYGLARHTSSDFERFDYRGPRTICEGVGTNFILFTLIC
jgi:hypothetical protein